MYTIHMYIERKEEKCRAQRIVVTGYWNDDAELVSGYCVFDPGGKWPLKQCVHARACVYFN